MSHPPPPATLSSPSVEPPPPATLSSPSVEPPPPATLSSPSEYRRHHRYVDHRQSSPSFSFSGVLPLSDPDLEFTMVVGVVVTYSGGGGDLRWWWPELQWW